MEDALPLVHVAGVAVIGDYKLRLLFEDGTVGDLSFEDREWNGVFEPLRDPAKFAQVKVRLRHNRVARVRARHGSRTPV